MQGITWISRILPVAAVVLCAGWSSAVRAENALLMIAHGSPDRQWNETLLQLETQVAQILRERGDTLFDAVRMSFLEFTEPSIHTAVTELERQGIDRIVGVPVFVAPSGHSVFDIPAVAGMYSDPQIKKTLAEDGAKLIGTGTNITLGPTLHMSEILPEIILDRVREISTHPDSEAVVLISHGSRDFRPFWSDLCRELGAYACGKTGITYFDYLYAGMGQSFFSQSFGAFARAAEKRPHVLAVGLYMAHGVDDIASFALARMKNVPENPLDVFEGINITFSSSGILPDLRVAAWIVDAGYEMLR